MIEIIIDVIDDNCGLPLSRDNNQHLYMYYHNNYTEKCYLTIDLPYLEKDGDN